MSAISSEIITRIVGYELDPANFQSVVDNLPARILILGEGNTGAQQALITPDVPVQIQTIADAAAIGGYGSPIYHVARILFPVSGNVIGSIPVFVAPQAEAGGATAKVMTVTATGTAARTGTHYLVINGRKSVDGQVYAVNIVTGDTPTVIHGKIATTIAGVLGAPVAGVGAAGQCTLTSLWKGLTANGITVSINTNGDSLGVTYAVATTTAGAGTPAVATALANLGSAWTTHIINTYGIVSTTLDALEASNGHPKSGRGPATGRWSPTVFKPFIAFTGSVSADPSASTDSRLNELTIKISPAPNSPGLALEAAANDCLLHAVCMQNTPHLDITGQAYFDMPVPSDGNIGVMSDWSSRDTILKKGCATVDLIGGQYVIQDPVTTYHPVGETIPAFRFLRNIVIDMNVRYTYLVKEAIVVKDKVIAKDTDIVSAVDVIKPKMWKAELVTMAEQFVDRGLIVDSAFMVANTSVVISPTNPDKLQTVFEYKRSGFSRQSDTVAQAGFNFGN